MPAEVGFHGNCNLLRGFALLEFATRDFLKPLIAAQWLRPEKALFYAHELAAVKRVLGQMRGTSLEYGCMDGVNSFVMLGGELDFDMDEYADLVGGTPSVEGDRYSSHRTDISNPVSKPAPQSFSVGASWRDDHLVKAARLRVYGDLKLAAVSEPKHRAKYDTIWSPQIFWQTPGNVISMLQKHSDALTPGGRIVTMFPDIRQAEVEIWQAMPLLPQTWVDAIDGGIAANLTRNARSDSDWRKCFGSVGLVVTKHETFLPEIVGTLYQTGLRPLFPALMKTYSHLRTSNIEAWRDVKRSWCDTLMGLLSPLAELSDSKPLWHVYELRKTTTAAMR